MDNVAHEVRNRLICDMHYWVKYRVCQVYRRKHVHRVNFNVFHTLHVDLMSRLMAVVDRGRSSSVAWQRAVSNMFVNRWM